MIFRNPYFQTKDVKVNGVQQFSITYDNGGQGKIMQKTDIGNYSYDANKIHQLKYLTSISNGANPSVVIGTSERNISYTSFLKTATITENNCQLTYTYGSDRQRIKSELKQNGSTIETKIYWDDMELLTKGGVTSEIYYISGPAGLSNIIVKKNGVITRYNAYTDQLGSILAVTDASGGLVAEQNFDAWGRKRNPANWTYTGVPATPDWLYRGFTGHEHVAAFNLINMNGRMYDPMTGLMLSPDNYVPLPFSPGGYNRYLYANGNPLKFVDPDGEFIFSLLLPGIGTFIDAALWGAVIGGASYTASVAFSKGGFNNWDWGQFGKSVGIGAISGVATAGIGSAFGSVGSNGIGGEIARAYTHGFANGMISEFTGGDFMTGFASGGLSSLAGSAFMMYGGKFANSSIGTYAFSGVAGGAGSALTGGNFWEGAGTGLMVAGLNHLQNSFSEKLAKAAEKYKNNPSLYQDRWSESSPPEGYQKCNYFLDDLSEEIGILLDRDYTSAEWADPNVKIPGWSKAYSGKATRGTSAAFQYPFEHATGHSGVITNPKGRYFVYNGLTNIRGAFIDYVPGWNNRTWYYRIPLGKR